MPVCSDGGRSSSRAGAANDFSANGISTDRVPCLIMPIPNVRAPEAGGNEVAIQNSLRVMSIDDHPLLREGIAAIVNSQSDMTLIASAATGAEGIEVFEQIRPDVTLVDLRLPDLSGIDVILAIRAKHPTARLIVLTTFDGDVEIQRALKAGASGYLLKSMPPKQMV